MADIVIHAPGAITRTLRADVVSDNVSRTLTLPNYKAPDVVVGVFDPPVLSGGQYVGDAKTITSGSMTGITAYRVFVNDVEDQTLGQTFNMPDPGAITDNDVVTIYAEVDGLIDGSPATVLTPRQVIYKHDMDVYGDDTASETMAKMAEHQQGDAAHLAIGAHENIDNFFLQTGLWSDPANWSKGRLPIAGENVCVVFGATCTFDMNDTPALGAVRVDGGWQVAEVNTKLRCRTFTPTRGCTVRIGSSGNRLPKTASFEVEAQTGAIDPATDPKFMEIGWVSTGDVQVWGYDYDPDIPTAIGQLPLAGGTSVTLARTPTEWEVGMEIYIPGTAYVLNLDGSTEDSGEYRTITAINGSVVSFAEPLLHDHDERVDPLKYGAISNRIDRQIKIGLMHRNVRLTSSDPAAPTSQRPHAMHMHSYGQPVFSNMGFFDCGRTDKQANLGVIQSDDQFRDYGLVNGRLALNTPRAALSDDNVAGRYGLHFHRCRVVDPNGVRLFAVMSGCLVKGSPGWGLVDHDSFTAMSKCAAVDVSGACFVAEQGNEDGYWEQNIAYSIKRYADGEPEYLPPKGAETTAGKFGDRFKKGIGFALVSRSVKMSDNEAYNCMLCFSWHHRYGEADFSPHLNMERDKMSFQRLTLLDDEFINTVRVSNVPLDNIIRNTGIGSYAWGGVVKAGGAQGHDHYARIIEAKGWALYRGLINNYIGKYVNLDHHFISTHYRPGPNNPEFPGTLRYSADNTGFATTRSEEVFFTNPGAELFDVGFLAEGGNLAVALNNAFSADRPRFGVFNDTFIANNGTDITLPTQDVGGQPQTPTTAEVTVITSTVPAKADVVMSGPFIIAELVLTGRVIQNRVTAQKASSLHNAIPETSSPFPYADPNLTWDLAGWPEDNDGVDAEAFLSREGYYTLGGDNIILFDGMVHGDPVYGHFSVDQRAVRIIGDVTGYTNNGPYALTTTPPTRADISGLTTPQGTELVIDVTTAAVAGDNGTPRLDTQSYRQPEHGVAYLNEPVAGSIQYVPNPSYVGTDRFAVPVRDDGNGSDLVEIDLTVG